MKHLWLISLFVLASCANPYSQFYQGTPDARTSPYYEPVATALQIYGSDDFDRDAAALMRRGYTPIGQSSFNAAAGSVSESQLRKQATTIGAHAVLISSKYSHTVSGAVPLTIPQTTTSHTTANATGYGSGGTVNVYGSGTTTTYGSQTVMMPYSVARSDFNALYFAKSKSRLGIFPGPLDDETRRRIQTNAGIYVKVVVEGSPAFVADVLPGDIVVAIGLDVVQSVEHYQALLDKYQGQSVTLRIVRGDAAIEKQVRIQSYASTTGGS